MTAAGFVPVAEMCLLKLEALTVFILAAFSLSVSTGKLNVSLLQV